MNESPKRELNREVEFEGPAWKHPYLLYIILTAVLFAGLVGVAWMAMSNGWIPQR